MLIKNDFNFEETVYLKTDINQYPRIITGICVRPTGGITYELSSGGATTWHYGFELDKEKNVLMKNENY
jgi:hypothetical protein